MEGQGWPSGFSNLSGRCTHQARLSINSAPVYAQLLLPGKAVGMTAHLHCHLQPAGQALRADLPHEQLRAGLQHLQATPAPAGMTWIAGAQFAGNAMPIKEQTGALPLPLRACAAMRGCAIGAPLDA